MSPIRPDSSALSKAPGRTVVESARAKSLSSSVPHAGMVTLQCDAPWGSYVAHLDVSRRESPALALERFHRRLSVELESIWERSEPSGSENGLGLAGLLMRPERHIQPLRFFSRQGTQTSAARGPQLVEQVRVRIQCPTLASASEHALDPAFLAPLCAALADRGARSTAEACVVGALLSMLHEELARDDGPHDRSVV